MQQHQENPIQASQTKRQKRRLNVFPQDSHLPNPLISDDSISDTTIISSQPAVIAPASNAFPLEILHQTSGEFGTGLVLHYLEKMIGYEADVLNDSDPEALHQMRVNGRRLRAIVELLSSVLDIPKKGQVNRLKTFHQTLGLVRNCDVIDARLRQDYYPNLPETEQELLDNYFAKLKKQRKSHHKKVKAAIYQQKFVSVYQSWLCDPQYFALGDKSIGMLLPGLLLPGFIQYHHHPAWDIFEATLTRESQTQLHYLRKIGKHCRYHLEASQVLYGDMVNPWIESLKKIQSALGALEDLNLLAGILLPASMPVAQAMLQEQRQATMAEWETLKTASQGLRQCDCYATLLEPLKQLA
jgi:CHAD domain-containing protein